MTGVDFASGAFASSPAYEPTLDDILSDPLVGLILRRDGLSVPAVRVTLERARERLGRRAPRATGAADPVVDGQRGRQPTDQRLANAA
ncbi:hypothetical protein MWN34_04655 [Ancylobacter sp. 6x-1]|uniref:Uncharacterized protein n=1 Tax=Ancylobacter crimeensis TaxID=2579147 RepID=A0ABT0D8C7_9HYPH|nr:hypothetical protein [Ancylobacter crimeensis]MCK0196197.1 hypothetical protein [Ancylobacter crimeensis]